MQSAECHTIPTNRWRICVSSAKVPTNQKGFSLFNRLIRILNTVRQYFGSTNLFIGLKWNGYSWIDLSSGQLVQPEALPWCAGNPQGNSFSSPDSSFVKISLKTGWPLLSNELNFTFSIWEYDANEKHQIGHPWVDD